MSIHKSPHTETDVQLRVRAHVCVREGEHDVGDDMSGSMAWMDEEVAIATLLFFFLNPD